MPTVAEAARELIAPLLAAHGLELFDLEYAGGRLVITVDREGGPDVDAIASATRTISRTLDAHDIVPGHYTLEVSSPGLERSLRTAEHYAWAVGRDVRLKLLPTVEGTRRVAGRLEEFDPDRDGGSLTLVLEDGTPHTVALADIDKARTVFVWGAVPKPVSPSRAAGPGKKKDPKASAPTPGADAADAPPDTTESAEKRVTA